MPLTLSSTTFSPEFTIGLNPKHLQDTVDAARAKGAALVVLLSQNGLAVDRALAGSVKGIDVILSGHSHDALPEPLQEGQTHIFASGCQGRYVARIDLDVRDGQVMGLRHKLIPIFSDLIAPDPGVAGLIATQRAPFAVELGTEVGRTEEVLYRRGTFAGSWDSVICEALMAEHDAQIALSPGLRWGTSVLPGEAITREDIFNATAIPGAASYRTEMTGATLREVLEDAADAVFNPDPFARSDRDMLRTGGLGFAVSPGNPAGQRIDDLVLASTGAAIDPARSYVVAGWGPETRTDHGPPIWEVLERHISRQRTLRPGSEAKTVEVRLP
jgi:sulfur-oxidizing protein SoxB